MRYFELHERVYAQRLARGDTGWDDGPYDDHALREAMQGWTRKSQALKPDAFVLELGCGTGALSCQLASAGYRVTGLDISPSAISFARAAASERGLSVEFFVANAADWLSASAGYDVIIDSHMLHCLALPHDRKAVLTGIRESMREHGELWTESMLLPSQPLPGMAQRIDTNGVLWVRTPAAAESSDSVSLNGELWLPTRYLANNAAALIQEYSAAGLVPIEYDVIFPVTAGDAPDFRARFRKAGNLA